jgi:outer membrane protein assembly factor BamD (BamD/ComL family)
MKKSLLVFATLMVAVLLYAPTSFGQGAVRTGPDDSVVRDAELEKDSLHNLTVARHYFKLKKAYVAALKRCEEIDSANPNFAKLDEVLYIAGLSSLRLAESKGKQKSTKTPDELRLEARVYLSRLVAGFPNSAFAKDAQDELKNLGGAIQPESIRP